MKMISGLFVTVFVLLVSSQSFAEVAVIVNPANNSAISEKDIKRIFLGKSKSFSDGKKITPYYLASGHKPRDEFNKKVLRKSESQLKAYWSKLIFTGKGTPPDALGSVEALIAAVAEDPSAIGYIDASSVDDKVKVIKKY